MTFGEKLQALRKARGWSQEELASQIHVSRQALSKWESGGAVPDTENIIALSRLFGVTTDYLLLDEVQDAGPAAPQAAWPKPRKYLLAAAIVGAVGVLQFDVVVARLKSEYNVEAIYESVNVATARWVECSDAKKFEELKRKNEIQLALDGGDNLTYIAPTMVNLNLTQERYPDVTFRKTREH